MSSAELSNSVTTLRTGFASGETGPFFFLAKGVSMKGRNKFKNLEKHFGAPSNSEVIMTENAYMTDEAYLTIVPKLCEGISKMKIIRDHPDWWIGITLDGFGSHVNVTETHRIFAKHKILIVKEEGYTSHINQPYDANVALSDKKIQRMLTNKAHRIVGRYFDQWYLIAVAIEAQKLVNKEVWVSSFRKVNLHPKHRVNADEWIKVLERRGVLSAEKYFSARPSMYDAMPVLWKRLSIEHRREAIHHIENIYDNAPSDELTWSKDNVLSLVKFVPLADVMKLRACYLAAKRDPSLIDRTEEQSSPSDSCIETTIDQFYAWKPSKLLDEYKKNKKNCEVQKKFFDHICNHVAEKHWNIHHVAVQPSAALNVEVSTDQLFLLNPSYVQVVTGHAMYDAVGKGAIHKIAKRRLDIIDGNVGSYSRVLNNAERLKLYKETNGLAAALAEVSAEREEELKRKRKIKDDEAASKKEKQDKKAKEEENKRQTVLPKLLEYESKYSTLKGNVSRDNLKRAIDAELKKTCLDDLLYYFYGMKKKEFRSLRKDATIDIFIQKLGSTTTEVGLKGRVTSSVGDVEDEVREGEEKSNRNKGESTQKPGAMVHTSKLSSCSYAHVGGRCLFSNNPEIMLIKCAHPGCEAKLHHACQVCYAENNNYVERDGVPEMKLCEVHLLNMYHMPL